MAASALPTERQTPKESSHPHHPASMRNLAAMTADLTASSRRCVHPSTLYLNHGRYIMQTPTKLLNIGADVAKDEIVMACSEGSFPVRKLANQRTALLAFPQEPACRQPHRHGIHRHLSRVVCQPCPQARLHRLCAQSQGCPSLCKGCRAAWQDRSCGCRTSSLE